MQQDRKAIQNKSKRRRGKKKKINIAQKNRCRPFVLLFCFFLFFDMMGSVVLYTNGTQKRLGYRRHTSSLSVAEVISLLLCFAL